MQYQNTFFDYTAKVIVRNSLCVLAPHPSLYRSIILAISNWLTMPSSSKLASIDSNGLRSSRRVEWKRLWRLAQGSLRSRRLEVVGTRHERGITTCLPRAPVLSFARYFQAPATQARRRVTLQGAEVCSLRQSSQGRFGGGPGKGRSSQAMVSNKWRISF